MKTWKSKTIFSLGEISPNLYHRTDLPQYEAGLMLLKNGYAKVEGTIVNCPELEVKQNNLGTIGAVFKDFLYNVDDRVNYKNILFLLDNAKLRLFKVNLDDTLTLSKEIATSYSDLDVKQCSIVQIENTVMICCKNKKPQMIRIDEDNIANSVLVDYWEAITDPPVKPIKSEFENKPVTEYGARWNRERFGNTVTIETTESAKVFSDAFVSKLVDGQLSIYGNLYRIQSAKNEGNKTIFKLIPIDADAITVPTVDENNAIKWENISVKKITFLESIFSGNRYPSLCSYYQGRLVFANVQGNPDFIAFSKTGDYFKFSGSVKEADSGFTLAIPSDERAIINGLISWNSLLITTNVGVWSTPIISAITPTESFLTRQMIPNFANIEVNSVISEGALYYVNYFKNKVYTLLYNYDSKVYQAQEISAYSNFMLKSGIKGIDKFKYEGNEYIVCEMNGFYAMCTIDRQQQVTSWNRYTITEDYKTIDLDDKTLFIGREVNTGVVNTKVLSYTIFKDDMEVWLLPPVMSDEAVNISSCPYIAKSSYSIGNVRLALIGKYEIEVNEMRKNYGLGHDEEIPYIVVFDIAKAGGLQGKIEPLKLKNFSSSRVEISAVYYTVNADKEVV